MVGSSDSYSGMRKRLITAFSILVIVPILGFALTTTNNLKKCAIRKIEAVARERIDHRAHVIELFLKKQGDFLVTLTSLYTADYLAKQENLDKLFIAVNKTIEIVDLHIIDSSGEQLAYVGPYRGSIKGKSYHGEPWFEEVLIGGRHISDVFAGHRDRPHIVVAVTDPLKLYVLRATINSEMFNALLVSAQIGINGDAYIVNRNADFQTLSLQGVKELPAEEKKLLQYHEEVNVQTIGSNLYITKWIKDGQWLLIIKSRIEDSLTFFYTIRNTNLVIISITSVIALLAIAFISWYIVRRLEKADRKRQEDDQQMVQVEKMATIGRLAAGIAHEINNPLQMITNQAGWINELLEDEDPSRMKNLGEYKESTDKIIHHVKRAGEITHRLLGFSRKMTAEKEYINVNVIIEETLSFVVHDTTYKNIKIIKKFDGNLPTTLSDGPQLQQVFLNLINNGLDAIGENGELEVHTRADADAIYIDIVDSGTGIKPEIMKKLYDPFFTTKNPGQGTGLGMTICYDIMRKLGGAVEAQNRVEGGAIFTVTLPIVKL
jgi:two-component system NtrC family sensor kinase